MISKGVLELDNALDSILGEKTGFFKNFFFKLDKYKDDTVAEFAEEANARLTEWEYSVKDALSDKLPTAALRHRPRDPSRRYPHMIKGDLLRSVEAGAKVVNTKTGLAIHSWAELGSGAEYYPFANAGKPARKDGQTPEWVGWINRVFNDGDSSRGITSVRDIFNSMVDDRRLLSKAIK